jgi:acetylglutamate kinase
LRIYKQEEALEIAEIYDISLIEKLQNEIVLIKYGGNAMKNDEVKKNVISDIITLKEKGIIPVIVHGGGPAIKKLLDEVEMESEFIEGHRKTDSKTMSYVEMALTGNVNSEIVRMINAAGHKAVGISGKDGGMVTARKRIHNVTTNGKEQKVDLGHVGDVKQINTTLVKTLIKSDFIPVISPIATGEDNRDYNINADMFAGHMAGALNAACYIALTNVDGLLTDENDPKSLIKVIALKEAEKEMGKTIAGGMIPKVESCIIALKGSVKSARIINGMKRRSILKELFTEERSGTLIRKES